MGYETGIAVARRSERLRAAVAAPEGEAGLQSATDAVRAQANGGCKPQHRSTRSPLQGEAGLQKRFATEIAKFPDADRQHTSEKVAGRESYSKRRIPVAGVSCVCPIGWSLGPARPGQMSLVRRG